MPHMNRRNVLISAAALLAMQAPVGCTTRRGTAATRFAADRQVLPSRFGEMAYVARGTGPAALFLHGFPLNGFQWRDVIDRLAPWRRCIVPDFLGMGHSRMAPGRDFGPRAQLESLMILLTSLGITDVDVIANDSGGAVAQLMVAHHPERVRSLLLTNCDTEIESPPAAMLPVIELARRGQFAGKWLTPWARDPLLARSRDGIGGMCYADRRHPTDEAIGMYFAPLMGSAERQRQLHGYAVSLERNALRGIRPALRSSRVPTRIVWGGDDTIFSAAGARYLADSFGNFRGLRVLARAKLFWPEERPETVAGQARLLWEYSRV